MKNYFDTFISRLYFNFILGTYINNQLISHRMNFLKKRFLTYLLFSNDVREEKLEQLKTRLFIQGE